MEKFKYKEFWISWGLIIAGIIYAISVCMRTSPSPSNLLPAIVLIIAGIVFSKYDKIKYKKYEKIIFGEGELSIEGIAAALDEDVSVTMKHLEEMVEKGRLKGHINKSKKEIVLHGKLNKKVKSNPVTFSNKSKPIQVTCESCGGKNKIIPGTTGKCEYCGSEIEA